MSIYSGFVYERRASGRDEGVAGHGCDCETGAQGVTPERQPEGGRAR